MLELTNVRLTPSQVTTFDHCFPAGSISVVLGANQSGKTDLCRLIAGLNTRARGNVTLDGRVIDDAGPRKRPVSLVYQAFINYPNLNVFENIASPLRAQKVPNEQVSVTVQDLAQKLGILDLLERHPHELSGGQQQRLAIARALAKGARVLLLDEPLVNLDFKLREALENELRELLRSTDTVVVYTSSDPRDAFALGDELLLLADGQKVQSGQPLAVYRHPESETAMELLADPSINRFHHQGVPCALRPEHLKIVDETPPPGGTVDFQMRVTASETNGDETFVHGQVLGQDWVLRGRGMLPTGVGDEIRLRADDQDIVRF